MFNYLNKTFLLRTIQLALIASVLQAPVPLFAAGGDTPPGKEEEISPSSPRRLPGEQQLVPSQLEEVGRSSAAHDDSDEENSPVGTSGNFGWSQYLIKYSSNCREEWAEYKIPCLKNFGDIPHEVFNLIVLSLIGTDSEGHEVADLSAFRNLSLVSRGVHYLLQDNQLQCPFLCFGLRKAIVENMNAPPSEQIVEAIITFPHCIQNDSTCLRMLLDLSKCLTSSSSSSREDGADFVGRRLNYLNSFFVPLAEQKVGVNISRFALFCALKVPFWDLHERCSSTTYISRGLLKLAVFDAEVLENKFSLAFTALTKFCFQGETGCLSEVDHADFVAAVLQQPPEKMSAWAQAFIDHVLGKIKPLVDEDDLYTDIWEEFSRVEAEDIPSAVDMIREQILPMFRNEAENFRQISFLQSDSDLVENIVPVFAAVPADEMVERAEAVIEIILPLINGYAGQEQHPYVIFERTLMLSASLPATRLRQFVEALGKTASSLDLLLPELERECSSMFTEDGDGEETEQRSVSEARSRAAADDSDDETDNVLGVITAAARGEAAAEAPLP